MKEFKISVPELKDAKGLSKKIAIVTLGIIASGLEIASKQISKAQIALSDEPKAG